MYRLPYAERKLLIITIPIFSWWPLLSRSIIINETVIITCKESSMIHRSYSIITASAVLLLSLFLGVPIFGQQASEQAQEDRGADQFRYLSLFEGLHITGKPIDVDIDEYRLNITGKVDRELSLTFSDVKAMKSVRKKIDLTCPGFFTDTGYWTGVPVYDLLQKAGIKRSATQVTFSTVTGGYTSELPIERVKEKGILVAYHFNDKEFHRVHGYPLRLVAQGEPGNVWVKWLGNIIVE